MWRRSLRCSGRPKAQTARQPSASSTPCVLLPTFCSAMNFATCPTRWPRSTAMLLAISTRRSKRWRARFAKILRVNRRNKGSSGSRARRDRHRGRGLPRRPFRRNHERRRQAGQRQPDRRPDRRDQDLGRPHGRRAAHQQHREREVSPRREPEGRAGAPGPLERRAHHGHLFTRPRGDPAAGHEQAGKGPRPGFVNF